MALLVIEDVWFKYPGDIEALKGVSLSVSQGEAVAVLGPNGSGKSTLLLVAAGLLKPTRGKVLFEDKPMDVVLPRARRMIGIVFQNPDDQLFNPTVYDEIAFALRQLYNSEEEVRRRVFYIAEKMGISDLLQRRPYRLSLGERKKVALASVLAYEPKLLLIDEPTANLSSKSVKAVKDIIRELRNSGIAIVFSSQDVEFVAEIADRAYLLYDGRMLGKGDPHSILSDSNLLSKAELEPPLYIKLYREIFGNFDQPPLTFEELVEKLKSKLQ